jgi:hypothetical protein
MHDNIKLFKGWYETAHHRCRRAQAASSHPSCSMHGRIQSSNLQPCTFPSIFHSKITHISMLDSHLKILHRAQQPVLG